MVVVVVVAAAVVVGMKGYTLDDKVATAQRYLLFTTYCLLRTACYLLLKVAIAQRHLLPRQLQLSALPPHALQLPPATIAALTEGYTREAGVRDLERQIGALCRHVAVGAAQRAEGEGAISEEGDAVSEGEGGAARGGMPAQGDTAEAEAGAEAGAVVEAGAVAAVELGPGDLEAVLGPAAFERGAAERLSRAGVAMGLAWTPTGGQVL